MQRTSNETSESCNVRVNQEASRQTECPLNTLQAKESSKDDSKALKLVVYIVDEVNQVITHYVSDPLFDQKKITESSMYREYVDPSKL